MGQPYPCPKGMTFSETAVILYFDIYLKCHIMLSYESYDYYINTIFYIVFKCITYWLLLLYIINYYVNSL